MTTYNTSSDAANTMVRAFLTKVGESYLDHRFNTSSGPGKKIWAEIKSETFKSKCAFCNKKPDRLVIEHLVMFNKEQCGLHHPGNIVPCCIDCNKRKKDPETNQFLNWRDHLKSICEADKNKFKERKNRIANHITNRKYPNLTDAEINALRAVAENLYSNTTSGLDSALKLFKRIDNTLVNV